MADIKNYMDVKLFSDFEVRMEDIIVTADMFRSDKLIKLFTYMVCNRKNHIRIQDLCEILWNEGESDNPTGALKNLFYRLRVMLDQQFHRKDFIITLRGAYTWNPEIEVSIDVERFTQGVKSATLETEIPKKIEKLEDAFQQYTGAFMPGFATEIWIIQQATYYHSVFISAVKDLAALYLNDKSYEKVEVLCNKALLQEALDEDIHCFLLKALIADGKKTIALDHYKHTKDLLQMELGTTPSKTMQSLYQELLKGMKNEELDLGVVQKELADTDESNGAYFCEYSVFKEMYTLQSRQAKRLGFAVHCGMITIEPKKAFPLGSDAYRKFVEYTMGVLKNVVLETLRSGDIAARFSATQFILLLPTCDYEGGLIAMERIQQHFELEATKYQAHLICDLKEMDLF